MSVLSVESWRNASKVLCNQQDMPNPPERKELNSALVGRRFKCCIVLCDLAWLDPDMKVSNGISATEQRDMLRLDAMIMMVQMNIRKLIDVSSLIMKCSAAAVYRSTRGSISDASPLLPCYAVDAPCLAR